MGTRSTVKFYENERHLVTIFHIYDGYLDGVGKELAEFLKGVKLINGITKERDKINQYANGMGCLAPQYIANKKDKVGNLYITSEDIEGDYNYKVINKNETIIIEIGDFKGNPLKFLQEMCTST